MAIALRQPTFKNPLPKLFKAIGKGLIAVLMGIMAFGESAGRARAAAELHRMGYTEEAKWLMINGDKK